MAELLLALFLFALIYGGLLRKGYGRKWWKQKDLYIFIIAGRGKGQVRLISEYNKTPKLITTVRAWKVEPDYTSEFVIIKKDGEVIHG